MQTICADHMAFPSFPFLCFFIFKENYSVGFFVVKEEFFSLKVLELSLFL